jgi:hypothetical protein
MSIRSREGEVARGVGLVIAVVIALISGVAVASQVMNVS